MGRWSGLFNPIEAPSAPRSATPDDLDDEALHAYYKRTAPLEDTRFILQNATLSKPLRKEWEQLFDDLQIGRVPDFADRYVALLEGWRVESVKRHPYEAVNPGKENEPCVSSSTSPTVSTPSSGTSAATAGAASSRGSGASYELAQEKDGPRAA